MKKKNKYFSCIFLFFIVISIVVFLWIGKMNIGLIIDRLGMTKNSFHIDIDKKLSSKDLSIYWIGESDYYIKEDEEKLNRILIYHQKFQSDILDSYGKNRFLIKYKDINYKKIGILKLHPYAKHNYKIRIILEDDNMIINWSIKNWYDPNVVLGTDTIRLEN